RAVVLLERDRARAGEVALELENVADVGAAEGVNGVVGDETVRDEVVRTLDVEVEDGLVESDDFYPLDNVERPMFVDHDHPGPHRGGGHEGQSVGPSFSIGISGREPRGKPHRYVENVLDQLNCLDDTLKVSIRGFHPPTA